MTAPAGIQSPLQVRDYRLLLTGMVIGQALMPLQFVTQIFWVQDNAGEGIRILLVGAIGTVRGAGQLSFGLFGGALADRFDRRALLIGTQSLALLLTLSLAAIIYAGDASAPWLAAFFTLTFLSSGMFAINAPTRQAIISEVLHPSVLARGIALSSAAMQIVLPVAILASGFFVDVIGYSGTYTISAAGHMTELAMLALLTYRGVRRASHDGAGLVRSGIRDIGAGWRYARSQERVFWLILLMMALVGLGNPAVANLGPTWVTTVVGVPVKYFGLIAITWAVGGFIVSSSLARSASVHQHGLRVIGGAGLFCLAFLLFASGHTVPFAVAGNLGLGAGLTLAQISASALVLTIVPNEMRGRIMSLLLLNMGVGQLITLPLAGIGQAVGLETLFPVLAVVCSLSVAAIAISHPSIWRGGGGTPESHERVEPATPLVGAAAARES